MPRRPPGWPIALVLLLLAALATTRAATEPPASARGPFLPSKHGFHFTNSFRGSPLPASLGSLGSGLSKQLDLPNHFGLCGGMCFLAHDNYDADRPPPPDTKPPESGTPLYQRIYARQADSLGPGITQAVRFAEWMGLPDDGPDGTRARTLVELPAILERLSRGELVHLGLVHVSFSQTRELWHNHQVLAYATANPAPGVVDILIYDPNHPGRDDIALRLHLKLVDPHSSAPARLGLAFHALPALGVEASLIVTDGTPLKGVRGFFAMPYAPTR